jgi:hypothetical protein
LLVKELKETRACLKLISRKEMIKPEKKLEPLKKEAEELIAIMSKSIETAKKNNQKDKEKKKPDNEKSTDN